MGTSMGTYPPFYFPCPPLEAPKPNLCFQSLVPFFCLEGNKGTKGMPLLSKPQHVVNPKVHPQGLHQLAPFVGG